MSLPNHEEKVKWGDSLKDVVVKLSEGNPDALNVLMMLIKESEKIDPDAAFGPFAQLFSLDSFGIYGSKIWILYKDICGENLVNMIAVMRSIQLGHQPYEMLERAFNGIEGNRLEAVTLNVPAILEKVKSELPNFAKGV